MGYVKLIPVDNKQIFINDIQKSFKESYEAVYGPCEEQVIPLKDIEQSFAATNAQAYFALIYDEIVGGVIVLIDKITQKNSLDLLYVKSGFQNKGIGLKIWQAIEKMYPETDIWETHTPYFDKRNIHFYVNKCGFKIVEFFNPKHKNPHTKTNNINGMIEEVGQYFFRFEKYNPKIL